MYEKLSDDLLLTTKTGKQLYEKYAKNMPIIDYHTHLIPKEIYENKQFEDLGEMWLAHDHYKWRAMRTFGIDESLITGNTSFYDKFITFAEIYPKLIGNPIYIWCALELKQYFDIDYPLSPENADEIYKITKEKIEKDNITPVWCLETSNVTMVSTTDDPVDSLEYHRKIKEENLTKTMVWPAFRPDGAFHCTSPNFADYMSQLGQSAQITISSFSDMMKALEIRLEYFSSLGTTISDNGLPQFLWMNYDDDEIEIVFNKTLKKDILSKAEEDKYKSAFLFEIAKLYHKHNFIMQLHAGGYGNANSKMVNKLGNASGFGCVDDLTPVTSIGALLDKLTVANQLPKTILYPLNGTQIESYAILAAGFCDDTSVAKVQLGAPWWFNDQIYGIKRQFEAVGNLYPISLSVGMLTDSRSFTAYPRHDIYRRILCDYFGELIERGEYFSNELYLKNIIQNICYNNTKEFFGLI